MAKKYSLKDKRVLIFLAVLIVLLSTVGGYFYKTVHDRNSFQAYKKQLDYCYGFYGGNHLSEQQMRDMWAKNEPIGC